MNWIERFDRDGLETEATICDGCMALALAVGNISGGKADVPENTICEFCFKTGAECRAEGGE